MSKINPMQIKALPTNRRILTWLCMCQFEGESQPCKEYARIVFALYTFLSVVCSTSSNLIFSLSVISFDTEGSLDAFSYVCGGSSVIYAMILSFFMRRKLNAIIEQLSKIYDGSKSDDSFEFLVQANDKSEWLWRFYFKYVMVGFAVNTIFQSALSIVTCILKNGQFHVNRVYHPYKLILPWNQSTKFGYFAEICFDVNLAETYFVANASVVLLFISICWHHQSFYQKIQHLVNNVGKGNDQRILCDFIRFHVTIKDWFYKTADAYSSLILVQLVCSMMFLACIVFQMDLYVKHFEHLDFTICILIISFLTSISTLFLYCFYGMVATESFKQINHAVFECDWLRLDNNLKKYLILIIANTQRPIFYHGFGMVVINLETFLKCMKTVMTYYMMFKTITE